MIRVFLIVVLTFFLILEKKKSSELEKELEKMITELKQKNTVVTIQHVKKDTKQNDTETLLYQKLENVCSYLQCKDPKLIKTAFDVAIKHDIDPVIFISLIYTESTFDKMALSPTKKYYGLGQIPIEIYDPRYNLEISAILFKNHLKIAKGNVHLAIANYKGYKNLSNPRAKKNVDRVFRIASFIRNTLNNNA